MATVQTARKTLSLPLNAKNVRAAVKAGTRAPKVVAAKKTAAAKKAPVVHTLQKVSKAIEKVWTESLVTAREDYKEALNTEVAVALALFSQKGDAEKVSLDAKRALMAVYADAGFDCKTHVGEDYKTVNRRINASADLYVKLGGRETVTDWIDGAAPKDQVLKIVSHVSRYKFEGINSILHYVGKAGTKKRPRNGVVKGAETGSQTPMTEEDKQMAGMTDSAVQAHRDASEAGSRRQEDKLPGGRILKAGNLSFGVPMDAKFEDVMGLATALTDFANSFLRVAAPAAATA